MPLNTDQDHHPPTTHTRRWFPGHRIKVRRVREFVAHQLNGCRRTDDAQLLASELASNALQHSESREWRQGFLVTVEHWPGDRLRISIQDFGSTTTPQLREPSGDTEHGRGLFLVDTIATRWDTHANASGNNTWFEIDCG